MSSFDFMFLLNRTDPLSRKSRFCSWIVLASVLAASSVSFAADYGKVSTEKIAEGIYLFATTGYGDVGLSGNSIAIISDEGVLVFDATGTPATARLILQELRRLTDQPVRYVVNSHWHWDHWGGNEVFKSAFPNVQIISHEKNRELMMHDSVEWNRDYLAKDIPGHIKEIEDAISAAKAKNAPADRISRLEELAQADRDFLRQKQTLTNTYPNALFSDTMRLFMGSRQIDIMHARAITPGDTFVFLPNERILLTGDILVYPIPYAIGGTYPSAWIGALEKLRNLKPLLTVPGHGGAEYDQTFLESNLALFRQVQGDVKRAKEQGLTLEQTRESLKKNSLQYAAKLGLSEKSLPEFQGLFLEGFVKNAYTELEHSLSDSPTR